MSSISGLSEGHRAIARHRVLQAALLGLHNAPRIHYTMGGQRWEGIDQHLVAAKGHFPGRADCSSFASWCHWNGLYVPFGVRDVVNGANWRAGFTGTMLTHGKRVRHEENVKVGDLAIYGRGAPGEHVAICIGGGMVISNGSEPGPFKLPIHYRSDLMEIRRYI